MTIAYVFFHDGKNTRISIITQKKHFLNICFETVDKKTKSLFLTKSIFATTSKTIQSKVHKCNV